MNAPRFYLVRLSSGQSHPKWKEWWQKVDNEFNGVEPDYTGHKSMKILQANQSPDDLKTYLSTPEKGNNFAEDVTVKEITKDSVQVEHAGYLEIIQKYFKAFDGL